MTVDTELLELMPHIVQIRHRDSVDGYNKPTFGNYVSYRCRIEGESRIVRNVNGRTEHVTHKIYLETVANTKVTDEILLPNGDKPPILSVETQPDEKGDFYEMLLLG